MTNTLPILWSFRRCPYAMRARLAIASAQIAVEHREILLRDKPPAFLSASPKGTVPVVIAGNSVIEESLDVMMWALEQSDPEEWLNAPPLTHDLIAEADGPFKAALDRYKYAGRNVSNNPSTSAGALEERAKAATFLLKLDDHISEKPYIFGQTPCLADMAILPFVRQFAHVDLDWFQDQDWPNLARWLDDFKSSERFTEIMTKHPVWAQDQDA